MHNAMTANDSEAMDPVQVAGLATASYPGGFRRGKAKGVRRILGVKVEANSYHVMSRTAGGEHLFNELEKEAFVGVMRRLERFAGVEVMTYAIMSNHFHLLVRVPNRQKFLARFEGEGGEEKLLSHLSLLYSAQYLRALRQELADLRAQGMAKAAEELLERFRKRFCDLPHFVKELKERYSRWFNKHHGRRGTLWMDRYKSVIVQDGEAMRTMASYIDLNPVRAGLVKDPKDYRWCGYAEAVAGSKRARRGLCRVLDRALDSWELKPIKRAQGSLTAAALYRIWLFEDGIETEKRIGLSAGSREKVRREAGKLNRAELLRCRVRYFSDGVAIGSRSFVDEVFEGRRELFGPNRKQGANQSRNQRKEVCFP